ncbi:hypothetical protein FB440_10759 [Vibrio crassostreae]|uniref:hypothetical protein n=1 Tax=Vibrio crassostreae TaxID=246167 RepID=UPI00119980FA|nr:hypothetical protein [Vibrio crassostreae]TWD38682.1 hypothetical protein FB440_10759 [Vibrio crassostreae]
MDANALTVLAILVAGYTLLAEEKRIDLKLRFSWVDKSVIGFLIITLLYSIYLPVLDAIDLALPLKWLWGFDEKLTAFTAIVAILLYLALKLGGKRLPKTKISDWQKESSHLLRNQKFEQLAFLMDKYHHQFITTFQDHWFDRIRAKLLAPYRPSIRELIDLELGKETDDSSMSSRIKTTLINLMKPFAFAMSYCLPDHSKYKEDISSSISDVFKSNLFVEHLAQTQPLLCAKFTTVGFRADDEFNTLFLKELIANRSSQLYRELRDNQNCSYTGEYFIDESNPLLSFYFKDIETASQIGIWKPIGDYTLEFIKKQKGEDSYYNQPFSYTYYEEEKWACPIFVSIFFFNVMTSRAIHTGHQNDMWLMYIETYVDEMLRNYKPSADVEASREFPTRFDYLMYQSLDALRDWVGAATYNSEANNKVRLDANSVPIFRAAATLGNTLYSLVKSNKLTDSQYVYYLEMVVRLMKELDASSNKRLSKLVVNNAIKQYEHSSPDGSVINALVRYYARVDHVLKSKESTFEKVVSGAIGKPLR